LEAKGLDEVQHAFSSESSHLRPLLSIKAKSNFHGNDRCYGCSILAHCSDDLASQISKEVKPLRPQLVAVVDFRQSSGSTMPQAHYFAWILSNYLEQRGKSFEN
jgi:hypothetical protein